MRRALPAAVVALVLALVWWFWPRDAANPGTPEGAASAAVVHAPSAPDSAAADRGSARARSLEEDFPIVAPLNRPDGSIARDLETLQHVFDAWRSNFPRDGNPVGENAEITAALAGENELGLALIPKNHPAIDARGELCDRWGTPFRFHQLSGQRMEIRSAGPDRRFGSDDDTTWTPP